MLAPPAQHRGLFLRFSSLRRSSVFQVWGPTPAADRLRTDPPCADGITTYARASGRPEHDGTPTLHDRVNKRLPDVAPPRQQPQPSPRAARYSLGGARLATARGRPTSKATAPDHAPQRDRKSTRLNSS